MKRNFMYNKCANSLKYSRLWIKYFFRNFYVKIWHFFKVLIRYFSTCKIVKKKKLWKLYFYCEFLLRYPIKFYKRGLFKLFHILYKLIQVTTNSLCKQNLYKCEEKKFRQFLKVNQLLNQHHSFKIMKT